MAVMSWHLQEKKEHSYTNNTTSDWPEHFFFYLGLVVRKPVFVVSDKDKVMLKPAYIRMIKFCIE